MCLCSANLYYPNLMMKKTITNSSQLTNNNKDHLPEKKKMRCWYYPLLCLIHLSHAFHLDIPLYLDVPHSFNFLAIKAQHLINEHISTLELTIPYTVTFLEEPHPSSYVLRMGYSLHESFFISPQGRTVTVFQTDALIVHSEVPVLIKDVVVRHLLGTELELWSQNYTDDAIGCHLDARMSTSLKIITDMRYLNWEDELFIDVISPVLNELQTLVHIDMTMEIEKPKHLDNSYAKSLKWGHDKLRLYIILTDEVELSFSSTGAKSMVVPQQGAVFTRRLTRPLTESDQIEVIERFTGLLLRVLGLPQTEPKSPYIRLDYMVRKQIYKNFITLDDDQREKVQSLVDNYKYSDALKLSWELKALR